MKMIWRDYTSKSNCCCKAEFELHLKSADGDVSDRELDTQAEIPET